jgi:hypothetical protein
MRSTSAQSVSDKTVDSRRCSLLSALEDGDSMFLRNVGIDEHINTAPNPNIKKKTNNRRENLKSQQIFLFEKYNSGYNTTLKLYEQSGNSI